MNENVYPTGFESTSEKIVPLASLGPPDINSRVLIFFF
jgi:hypothetical protein